MLDLSVALLALLALLGIAVIVVRRFPTLASIDTKRIPAERHGELKSRLIEERLKRKLKTLLSRMKTVMKPLGSSFKQFIRRRYERLLELEQRYRANASIAAPLSSEERAKKDQRVDTLLVTAEDALRHGNLEQAETKCIEAISVDPRNVSAYRLLASVYVEQKDYEHARETLQFVIERLHVEDDELYAELGTVASGEGNLEEAKHDFEKSIFLNGQVAQHFLDLCRIHLSLGDSRSAFENCRRAVEIEPNNPKFLDALVETSIVAGKKEWAMDTLGKLRKVNPENQKLAEFSSRIDALSGSARPRRR